MKPALSVVCTPIGNLADLSPRAADALKRAAIVLCEDTRHSRPLLDKLGAHGRALSCHAHNESERAADVVDALTRGEHVALISDAGAPGVSDPGARLVDAVVAAGFPVEVLPGPSALTAALMGAGLDVARFAFLGFLPRKGGGREQLLEAAARTGFGVVVYEAPQRALDTLADLAEVMGPRRVVVARELTKVHETFHRGRLGSDSALAPPFVEKGELVIVVEAGEAKAAAGAVDVDAVARDTSLTPKERARRVAKALGISVKDAYERVRLAGDSTGEEAGGADVDVARARDLVAAAARALVDADARARAPGAPVRTGGVSSEIPGADELMAFLARPTSLRAPVEAQDAAKALLASLAALDALLDALAFERENR